MVTKYLRFFPFIKNLAYLCLVVASIATLSSCAKYTPHKLRNAPSGKSVKKDNITITAALLSDDDCHYYFSRRLLKHGYQPIQLLIENETNQNLALDAKNIDLPLESSSSVAKAAKLNTTGRAAGWYLLTGVIPAVVEGVKSSNANKKLDIDFEQRTISHDSYINIPAHSTMNKVMFVTAENLKTKFKLNLLNKDTQKNIHFDITA